MIKIVNYGLGNIDAFLNIYKRLGIEAQTANNRSDLIEADKIVLPGVGAFDYAMKRLNESGMRGTLDDMVLNKHVPVIGICVGMQMMAKRSEEGVAEGLGWFDAEVLKFKDDSLLVPEMGWNSVEHNDNAIFDGLTDHPRFYFLHSYYFKCNNADDVIGTSDYGITFASAVNKGNIYGIQFHPEKSHNNGVKLLENFAKLK